MSKAKNILGVLGLGLVLVAILAPVAFAETTLISPIPGFEQNAGKDLGSYITAIFTYGIGLAGLIAMAQLVFGAVQYTTSAGAPSLQEDAKSRMRSAIVGLILLLTSTIILVSLSKNFGKQNLALPPSSPTTPVGEDPSVTRQKDLNKLTIKAMAAADRLLEKHGVFSQTELEDFLTQSNPHWYIPSILEKDLKDMQTLANNILDEAGDAGTESRAQTQEDLDTTMRYLLEMSFQNDFLQGKDGKSEGLSGGKKFLYGTTPEQLETMINNNIEPRYRPTLYK